jgi:glycosyltransferase involved in cell wall biosynthesis
MWYGVGQPHSPNRAQSHRASCGVALDALANEPRVSVVIVNWNYAAFVADAIRSVKEQSYQNFECIVVDNGSDDGSVDQIVDAIAGHPQFTLHRLPSNLGHLGGALWALQHVTGEFLTFLDADDVLATTYLASHLQAHLAAVSSVGFTSSNCVDVNAQGFLLTGGSMHMYRHWQNGVPGLRPIERTVRLRAVEDSAYAALAEAVRYVPAETKGWCWCPGSSNMFRRQLLDRIRPTDPSPKLFGGVDGFYLPILHALTGVLLIDLPLSAYRLHESNDHSALPSLSGVRGRHPRAVAPSLATYVRMISWVIDCTDELLSAAIRQRYWQVLDVVASIDPRARTVFSMPELQAIFARRFPQLVDDYGALRVFYELRRRVGFRDYVKIVRAARPRANPLVELSRAVSLELALNGWRLGNRLRLIRPR